MKERQMATRKTTKKQKTSRQAAPVVIWDVTLSDGNWYWVFARSKLEAVLVVQMAHYQSLSMDEFRKKYKPTLERIPDHRKLLVNDEEVSQQCRTARMWAKGKKPGTFVSNTYEI